MNIKNKFLQIRISDKDHEVISQFADKTGRKISDLVRDSLEPVLIKKKIDSVIDGLEKKEILDIHILNATKNLLEHYIRELDARKLELQNKIDNIDLAKRIIDTQNKVSPAKTMHHKLSLSKNKKVMTEV